MTENERLATLARLGFSPPVLQLAAGKASDVHPLFKFWCETPWWEEEDPELLGLPEGGKEWVPLWRWGGTGYMLVRERDGRAEVIEFYADMADDWRVVAYSEQGLLAHLFQQIVDASTVGEEQDIKDAAASVGFRHLNDLEDFRRRMYDHTPDYEDQLNAFTRGIA